MSLYDKLVGLFNRTVFLFTRPISLLGTMDYMVVDTDKQLLLVLAKAIIEVDGTSEFSLIFTIFNSWRIRTTHSQIRFCRACGK